MDYAIIRVGGKQYRVREGETLLVDRVTHGEGDTFSRPCCSWRRRRRRSRPATVTARVVADVQGHEDPHRQVPARTATSAQRLPREPLADRDRVDRRRQEARRAAPKARPRRRRRPSASAEAASAPPPRIASRAMPAGYEELTGRRRSKDAVGRTGTRPMLEAALGLRAGARQAQGRARRARVRARADEGGELDGTQERPRLVEERPRLEPEAPRRQDLRRPGGEGRA